jgi:N-acetyl-anhydromuramyl-L-alanine amidase AmpD
MVSTLALAALLVSQPPIVPREEWGARAAALPMRPLVIRYITVHHAGVATNRNVDNRTKLRNLQAWSQREDATSFAPRVKPAWPDVPYHYYIYWDGEILEARQSGFSGDTNTEYDPAGHLLICLEGNFQTEQPTEAQLRSLEAMTRWGAAKYGVLRSRIGAHRDYAQTTCPGDNLMPHARKLRLLW